MRRLTILLIPCLLLALVLPALARPPHRGYTRRAPHYRMHGYRQPARVYRGNPWAQGPVYHRSGPVYRRGPVYWTPPFIGPRVVVVTPEPVYVVPPPRVRIVRRAPAYEVEPEPVYEDEEQWDDEESGDVRPEDYEVAPEAEGGDDTCPMEPRGGHNAPRIERPAPPAEPREWKATEPVTPSEPAPEQGGGEVTLDQVEAEILHLTNNERQRAGLAPVGWEPRLALAARAHSEEMAGLGFFAHESPTPGSKRLTDRMKNAGITGYERATENIAMGTFSAEDAASELVKMWMNSEGHRKNILDPDVRLIGVGTATNARGQIYATQDFSKVATPAAPPEESGDRNAPAEI